MVEIVGRTEYRVPYADTDQMGVVYYGNYLTLFERARNELLRTIDFTYRELEALGIGLPVVEAGIHYRSPARYDDLLQLEARCAWCQGVRLRVNCRILRGDTLLAEGHTIHAFLNLKNGRPLKPTPELLDKLRPALPLDSNDLPHHDKEKPCVVPD